MAVAGRDHAAGRSGLGPHPRAERGLDRREVGPLHVIGVAAEIFRRELPVARHDPFMRADHLDPALAAVEERIEVPGHFAEVVAQWRRLRVEGGEQQSLVAVQLRNRHQTPVLALQFAAVEFPQIRHPDEPAVVAVGPAVIGAGEARGVAAIGAAQPIAAMPADIKESAHPAVTVAHHQNRIFAHIGRQEITGLRDLAFVAQEQPTAGEDPLQLLLVDLRLDKDASADEAFIVIDQPVHLSGHSGCLLCFRPVAAFGEWPRHRPSGSSR